MSPENSDKNKRESIKSVLSMFRPGTSDENDPFFREALEALGSDGELAEWFEREQQFDSVLRSKLSSIEVPENLRSSIIDLAQSGTSPGVAVDEVAEPATNAIVRPWFMRPMNLIGAAALLAAGIFVLAQINPVGEKEAPYAAVSMIRSENQDMRRSMAEWLTSENLAQVAHVQSFDEIRKLIDTSFDGYPSPAGSLKMGADELQPVACQALDWGGEKVMLTCFRYDGTLVHLLVASTPDHASGEQPDFAPIVCDDGRQFQSAAWKDTARSYVLLTRSKREGVLESVIESSGFSRSVAMIIPSSGLADGYHIL